MRAKYPAGIREDLPSNAADQSASPPHPWTELGTTFAHNDLKAKPVPKEMICNRYPVGCTSALVSMGGVGKTTWVAHNALQYLGDNMEVLFVSAEDAPEDYQAKLHHMLFDEGGEISDVARVSGRIHVLNLRGAGVKLVTESLGSYIPSEGGKTVISYIKEVCPKVRLVVFETVSRFAGGEDNERMEAAISGCDYIAAVINGACLLIHHMGKSQARDKVIDLYSGRGGSTLGDNTRSMTVLTRLDKRYMGVTPVVVEPDDLNAGRAFEVCHVRNSYGVTLPPEYFITRKGYCNGPILESVPIATADDVVKEKHKHMNAARSYAVSVITEIIDAKGGRVPKAFFDSSTKDLTGLSQAGGRALIKEMLDDGSLRTIAETTGKTEKLFLALPKF